MFSETPEIYDFTSVSTVSYTHLDVYKRQIYKTLKNYYDLLSSGKIKLFDWGAYRWYEGFVVINLIYDKYPEKWLEDLARLLKTQGTNYNDKMELWKRPLNQWTFDTHIVNLAMMLKSEAVSCDILKESYTNNVDRLYEILYRYNSTSVGLFTGDECLSGLSPIQGTELCACLLSTSRCV